MTVTKPYFSGNQFGYHSFMSYPFIPELNFDLDVRFKFALNNYDNETTLLNSVMMYTGQKGGNYTTIVHVQCYSTTSIPVSRL